MKKLEDIPKKDIFNVPDGYFEKLPGVIQSRIAENKREPRSAFRYALHYGLLAVAVVVLAFIVFKPGTTDNTPESILASIETEALVAYLDETDISTDELLDHAVLDEEDALQIEEDVYDLDLENIDLENITNDLDL